MDLAYIKTESSHGNKLPRYYGLSLRDIFEGFAG